MKFGPEAHFSFVSRAGICLLRPSISSALFVCRGNGSAADREGIYMLNLPIKTGRKESYSYKLYTSAENKHETLDFFQCLNDISGTLKSLCWASMSWGSWWVLWEIRFNPTKSPFCSEFCLKSLCVLFWWSDLKKVAGWMFMEGDFLSKKVLTIVKRNFNTQLR